MTRYLHTYKHLSNLLTSLEDDILKMSDSEVISTLCDGRSDVRDVTRLINAQLSKHRRETTAAAALTSKPSLPQRPAGRGFEERTALLRLLLQARPELSPQLQAVFTAGGTPSKTQIDKCIAELIRKGVLSKDG